MEHHSLPERTRESIEHLLQRYGDGKRRAKIEPLYWAMQEEVEHLAEPQEIHREFQRAALPELTNWVSSDTSAFVLAVCTLGPRLQEHLDELYLSDMVSAFVLDEINLIWVTAFTRQIHSTTRNDVKKRGLKAGPAYRPGVGRWPLSLQQLLFARLAADRIGVALNESLVMVPRQSTSLIIPLFDRR